MKTRKLEKAFTYIWWFRWTPTLLIAASNLSNSIKLALQCKPSSAVSLKVPAILGPLLFILYINDLPNASELTDPLLFADDTSIFYSHSNPNCLESVLNDELQNIDVWQKRNKLSVNIKKTNYVIFKPRQKKFYSSISLSFGGKPLQQSNITKFLRVYIDDHLTWKHHNTYVCKQIAKSMGIIFRSRFFLSSITKLTLYYTLIYPYIVYCNCAWSSTYVSNLNSIYYLQKRAVRAITNSDYRAHSAPLFSNLVILDIFQVNTLEIAKFMFYYRNNIASTGSQSFCNE